MRLNLFISPYDDDDDDDDGDDDADEDDDQIGRIIKMQQIQKS